MNPMPTLPITITGHEAIHLLDCLRNGTTVEEREDELGELRDLVVKLGSVYREFVTLAGVADGEAIIDVTEDQAWLMRGHVMHSDLSYDGKCPIGVTLSLKLYSVFDRFAFDLDDFVVIREEDHAKRTSEVTNESPSKDA